MEKFSPSLGMPRKRFGAAKAAALVGFLFGSDPALAGGKPTHEQVINFWGGQKAADQLVASRGDVITTGTTRSSKPFDSMSKAEKQKILDDFWGGKQKADSLVAPRKR